MKARKTSATAGPGSVVDPDAAAPTSAGASSTLNELGNPIVKSPCEVRIRPRILLAASGSVASIKFCILAKSLSDWAEVKAICTKPALHFVDRLALPPGVPLYTDEEEWATWKKIGDPVLHIELRKWADVLVIAPLSANTLAKIAGGLCDNLLTCVVRAWNFSKPLLVAPAMNTLMWENPFTSRQVATLEELGVRIIPPVSKKLACGDVGSGAMAEPESVEVVVRMACLSIDALQPPVPRMTLHSNGYGSGEI